MSLKSHTGVITFIITVLQRYGLPDYTLLPSQPTVSLRDLGLSDIRLSQLDELVSRLLPASRPEEPPAVPSPWRTSHVSGDSFFHNKHGEQLRPLS